jgi:hypothetical protein
MQLRYDVEVNHTFLSLLDARVNIDIGNTTSGGSGAWGTVFLLAFY